MTLRILLCACVWACVWGSDRRSHKQTHTHTHILGNQRIVRGSWLCACARRACAGAKHSARTHTHTQDKKNERAAPLLGQHEVHVPSTLATSVSLLALDEPIIAAAQTAGYSKPTARTVGGACTCTCTCGTVTACGSHATHARMHSTPPQTIHSDTYPLIHPSAYPRIHARFLFDASVFLPQFGFVSRVARRQRQLRCSTCAQHRRRSWLGGCVTTAPTASATTGGRLRLLRSRLAAWRSATATAVCLGLCKIQRNAHPSQRERGRCWDDRANERSVAAVKHNPWQF